MDYEPIRLPPGEGWQPWFVAGAPIWASPYAHEKVIGWHQKWDSDGCIIRTGGVKKSDNMSGVWWRPLG